MKSLIVGGGIGGLTAARVLADAGHDVVVLERSERFDPIGAGIVLAPNATQLLHSVGVDLADTGRALTINEIQDVHGRTLQRVDLSELARDHGPTWALARPALHDRLIDGLESRVELRMGSTVAALDASPDGVEVDFGSARREQFDLVVGADGINSSTREQTLGEIPKRYSGTTCWRGIAPGWGLDRAIEAWDGAARVGLVPLPGDLLYYFLVLTAPRHTPGPASLPDLLASFSQFEGEPAQLFARLDAIPPTHHDLEELDRPVWGTERVLLLGDAAHAMTPNLGQGAAMAIEDAFALDQAVRPGLAGAAGRYSTAREARVRRLQLQSRRIGAVAHLRGRAARAARNALLRTVPDRVMRKQQDRLVAPGLALIAQGAPANR